MQEHPLAGGIGELRQGTGRVKHLALVLPQGLEVIPVPLHAQVRSRLVARLLALLQPGIELVVLLREAHQPAQGRHPRLAIVTRCPGLLLLRRPIAVARIKTRVGPQLPNVVQALLEREAVRIVGQAGLSGAWRARLLLLFLVLSLVAQLVVVEARVEDGLEAAFSFLALVLRRQGRAFAVEQFPVAGLQRQEAFRHGDGGLVLAVREQAVDGLQVAVRLRLAGDEVHPDIGRLVHIAGAHQQLGQSQLGVAVAGRGLLELPLILERQGDVAFAFGQVGELAEKLRVAGIFREQALELLPGRAQVAGGLKGVGHANRHLTLFVRLTPFALQAFHEPVELVVLDIQLGQPRDDAQLAVEVIGLVEGAPEQLDRLARAEALSQGVTQRLQAARLRRVGPNGAAEGFEPFFAVAELEAELGVELIMLRVARRGGEEVTAGLERLRAPAQPRFQLGDVRQILGPEAPVDSSQLAVGLGGGQQVAAALVDARGSGEDGDRLTVLRQCLKDGLGRLREVAVGFVVSRQAHPALHRRLLARV